MDRQAKALVKSHVHNVWENDWTSYHAVSFEDAAKFHTKEVFKDQLGAYEIKVRCSTNPTLIYHFIVDVHVESTVRNLRNAASLQHESA